MSEVKKISKPQQRKENRKNKGPVIAPPTPDMVYQPPMPSYLGEGILYRERMFGDQLDIYFVTTESPKIAEYLQRIRDEDSMALDFRWTEKDGTTYPWLVQIASSKGVLIILNTKNIFDNDLKLFLKQETFYGYNILEQMRLIEEYYRIQPHISDVHKQYVKAKNITLSFPDLIIEHVGLHDSSYQYEDNRTEVWNESNKQKILNAAFEIYSLFCLMDYIKKEREEMGMQTMPVTSIKPYITPTKMSTILSLCTLYSPECTSHLIEIHFLAEKIIRGEITRDSRFTCNSCNEHHPDLESILKHIEQVHMNEKISSSQSTLVDICVINDIIVPSESICKRCNCTFENIEEHCTHFHSDQLLTVNNADFNYHVFAEYLCTEFCCGVHGDAELICTGCELQFNNNYDFVIHQLDHHFSPVITSRDEILQYPLNNEVFASLNRKYPLYLPDCIMNGIVDVDCCNQCRKHFSTEEELMDHLKQSHVAFIPSRETIEFTEDSLPLEDYRHIPWDEPYTIDVCFFDTYIPVRVVSSTDARLPFILDDMHDGKEVIVDFEWAPVFYRNRNQQPIDLMQIATSRGVLIVMWEIDGDKDALQKFFTSEDIYGKGVTGDMKNLRDLFGIDIVVKDIETLFLSPHGITLNFTGMVEHFLGDPAAEFKNKKISISNWAKRPLNSEQILYSAFDVYAIYKLFPQLLTLGPPITPPPKEKPVSIIDFRNVPTDIAQKPVYESLVDQYCRQIPMENAGVAKGLKLIMEMKTAGEIQWLEPTMEYQCNPCGTTIKSLEDLVSHVFKFHKDRLSSEANSVLASICSIKGIIDIERGLCNACNCPISDVEDHCLEKHIDQMISIKGSKGINSILTDYFCQVFKCGVRNETGVQCPLCESDFESDKMFVQHQLLTHFYPVVCEREDVEKWPLNGRVIANPRDNYVFNQDHYAESGKFTRDSCIECNVQFSTDRDFFRHLECYHLAFIPNCKLKRHMFKPDREE